MKDLNDNSVDAFIQGKCYVKLLAPELRAQFEKDGYVGMYNDKGDKVSLVLINYPKEEMDILIKTMHKLRKFT